MAGDNPLRDTYDALWTLLESKTDFTDLFPNGTPHQVRYTTDLSYAPDPDLEERPPAHYPICRVLMHTVSPLTEQDSTYSQCKVRFIIEICTGQQYQSILMGAWWAVFRAMLGWRTHVRDAVTWQSKPVVFDVNADESECTDQNTDRNRGTQQWIAVWSTVVSMTFTTTDLQEN